MNVIEAQSGEQAKPFFLSKVNQLFDDIKNWLADKQLHIEQEEVRLNEELTGVYMAPKLVISSSEETLADIKPYGADIIEAKGRIDIIGGGRTENIGYFINGGPRLAADKQLYQEIEADGWYWVANSSEPKAGAINQDLFLKLLKGVSHYEL